MKVPRVVEGAGVVVGVAGGNEHSMAVRESGEVVVFGTGKDMYSGTVDGRLGLGAEVGEALEPTVVPGIHAGAAPAGVAYRTG